MFVKASSPHLALFDLDGTLVPWDTQLLFSNFLLKRRPLRRLLLIPFFLALPLFLLKILGEGSMKRLYLGYLAGLSPAELDALAEEFAAWLIPAHAYGDLLARLRRHQEQGDLCLLVSASPTLYARSIGKALGFEIILASDTEEADPFPFLPRMPYGNNKGETKVLRLRAMGYLPALSAPAPSGSIAYSDSRADLPMLNACEQAVLVNPSPSLTRIGEERGWEIVRPATPWSGKMNKMGKILLQLFGFYPL